MEERLEPARTRFVRRIEPQHRQIGVSRLIDHPAQPGCCRRADVLDVDRLVGANRQCCWPESAAVSRTIAARCAASPSATKSARPMVASARSTSRKG